MTVGERPESLYSRYIEQMPPLQIERRLGAQGTARASLHQIHLAVQLSKHTVRTKLRGEGTV